VASAVAGQFGRLTVNADGSYSYAVDDDNAAVQALRNTADTLTDTFSYTVRDTAGATATATLTLTIHGANDAPAITAVPTTDFDANDGTALTLDPDMVLRDVDTPTLTGATVRIASGLSDRDRLHFTDQNGITGVYDPATGVLTLTGIAPVAVWQAALRSVTFTTDVPESGTRAIAWQVNDGIAVSNLSAIATTTVNVTGLITYIPMTQDPVTDRSGQGFTPESVGSFARQLTISGESFVGPPGAIVYFVRGDVHTKVSENANIEITIPLASIEAPLGGDIASVTAQLADGQPLPAWLKFDPATGTFTGQVPDEIVTGSLPGQGGAPDDGSPQVVQPTTMTIKVVVRDSKGQQSIMTFTVTLPGSSSSLAPGGRPGAMLPFDMRAGLAPDAMRDFSAQLERAVANAIQVGHSADAAHVGVTPAGRAGLTDQLNKAGWRGMHANRTALLDSLRAGATVH
jgi:VCBS repeat-containing protein